MSIDRRITNGLAWAGVLLVVGVPTADLLSAQLMGDAPTSAPVEVAMIERIAPIPAPASQRPAAPVAKPAAQVAVTAPKPVATPKPDVAPATAAAAPVAKPAVTPAAQTADAVDAFLQSGRPLPSYITEAGAPAAPTQVAATPPTRPVITTPPAVAPSAAVDPIEVAAIPPQKVAPMPMPLSMRPAPVAAAPQQAIVIPSGLTPAAPDVIVRPPANVTSADLEDWETGPLSDFLAERQPANAYVDPGYDPNGFFLDEGPNRRQRDRVIAREIDEPLFIFD